MITNVRLEGKPFLPSPGQLKLACNFPLALTNLPKTPHSAPDSEITCEGTRRYFLVRICGIRIQIWGLALVEGLFLLHQNKLVWLEIPIAFTSSVCFF